MPATINEQIMRLKSGIESNQHLTQSMACYAWMTKALVVQAGKEGYTLLEDMLGWLSDSSKASHASDAFETVVKDDKDGYITVKSFCSAKVWFYCY